MPAQTVAQSRHDEAWGLGPGTPSTLERMAALARNIETECEIAAKPDWYFGWRATSEREKCRRRVEEFEATLAELMERNRRAR